ncbi:hypothetical protein SO802_005457 [Lithocarpus litseifolius]|uniref:SAWADEE domain-containing protein n=1 Tax=Lithocarpus litseifolius TaxID=425828 RepID=A0AAW2DJJ6_9ROSI
MQAEKVKGLHGTTKYDFCLHIGHQWASANTKEDPYSLKDISYYVIKEMEKIFKDVGEQSLGQEFCQDIATSFSHSASCKGKSAIKWEQSWFLDKQEQLQDKATPSSGALKLFVDHSDAPISSNAPQSSTSKVKKASDLSELRYEAKLSKDNAWYDVALFLSYRVLHTGELEVRVRYAGFGKEDDEWVKEKIECESGLFLWKPLTVIRKENIMRFTVMPILLKSKGCHMTMTVRAAGAPLLSAMTMITLSDPEDRFTSRPVLARCSLIWGSEVQEYGAVGQMQYED